MKKVFPHVFALFAFCFMFSLGVWQMQRLEWKTQLIAKIDKGLNSAPITLTSYQGIANNEYKLLQVEGEFLTDKDQELLNRTFNGKPGVHILSPIKTKDGNVVIVNRGWVPVDEKYDKPVGVQVVTGIVRSTQKDNWIALKNEVGKGFWYWVELDKIYQSVDAKPQDFYLDLVSETPNKTYPYALPKKIELYNEHLTYAITWFSLSLALLITYYFRFHRK